MRASRLSVSAVIMIAVVALVGCQSVIGPSPVDDNWRAHVTARFTLHVRPGSFADQNAVQLGDWLEAQYDATVSTLNLNASGRVFGFLFNSAAEAGNQFGRSGTAFQETASFKAVCVPPLDAGLFSLLAHEANHVILWSGLGRAGTTFMNEGLASAVVSGHVPAAGPSFLHGWARNQMTRIPPMEELVDDDKWRSHPQDIAYNGSASFLAYLIQRYGADRLKQIHGATSPTFAQRFNEVYGRALSSVEQDWKQAIAQQ